MWALYICSKKDTGPHTAYIGERREEDFQSENGVNKR